MVAAPGSTPQAIIDKAKGEIDTATPSPTGGGGATGGGGTTTTPPPARQYQGSEGAMGRLGDFTTGWLLDGQVGRDVATTAGSGLSGIWNFVKNIPNMRHGDKWVGILSGGAAALFFTNMVKGWFGPVGRIPGAGLVIGIALFFLAGKAGHSMVAQSDSGNDYGLRDLRARNTIRHNGGNAQVSLANPLSETAASFAQASGSDEQDDLDNNNETYIAAQVGQTNGTSHADLSMLAAANARQVGGDDNVIDAAERFLGNSASSQPAEMLVEQVAYNDRPDVQSIVQEFTFNPEEAANADYHQYHQPQIA